MYFKKVELLSEEKKKISFFILKNNKFFLYDSKTRFFFQKYLTVPLGVKFSIRKKQAFVQTDSVFNKKKLGSFKNFFLKNIRTSSKEYSKKLLLKGLGFKVNLIQDSSILQLKLGFSHIVTINIPQNKIFVVVKKNTIHIRSCDQTKIGNFCKKIQQVRKLNIYNGKGIRNKYDNIILKIFKKK